jgi:hypothetical protein
MAEKNKNVITYGKIRPIWADNQFAQWLTAHCSAEDAQPVFMPMQLCINGTAWIKEQFREQTYNTVEPDENTAREMFGTLVAIHVTTGIHQVEIFEQIFEGYLRNLPKKA